MTDQPYTPTTEEIRDYVEMGGEPRPWEPPTPEGEALEIKRREAFDRWLAAHDAAIEAAAEQRGAEEGWDLAIDYAWDDSSIYEADAKRAKAANPYRADQEGDDE